MTHTENLPAINNSFPSQIELQNISIIAKTANTSGLYAGLGGEAKIMMILLAAKELGIGPCIALNGGIWSIQGKIEISARLMNSMIRRAGHTMQITSTRNECTIVGMRADTKEVHTEIFTLEMAERAGIAKGNVWLKYAEDMLYARCMSRLARRLFPDVIGTSYVEGELRESKEPKEELQPMAYEEVTPYQNDNHNECQDALMKAKLVDTSLMKATLVNTTSGLPISTDLVDTPSEKNVALNQEQIDTLASYLPKLTPQCKSNFFNFFGIKNETELYKIPADKYNGTIKNFDFNIDNQQKAPA